MYKINCLLYLLITSVVTYMLISVLGLEQNYFLMLCYSINSACAFLFLLKYEIQNYVGLNLNLILLVGYFSRLVYPEVTMSLDVLNGEDFYFLKEFNVVTDYLFPTIVGMNIFYSVFYLVLSIRTSHIVIDDYIQPYFYKYNISKFSFFLFFLANLYDIASAYLPYDLIPNFVATILGRMLELSLLLQILNCIYNYSKNNHRLLVFYVLYSVIYATFFGFFKGGIVRPIILYCLYYFLHCKSWGLPILNKKFILLITFLGLFTTYFVYPFMTTKRQVAGYNVSLGKKFGATKDYSNIKIIEDVIDGKAKTVESNGNPALDRMNAITANAFFYKSVAKEGGHYDYDILKNNMKMLIPRFIYPEKGTNLAGLMAYAYAMTGSFKNYKSSVSNNYLGQFAGAYLNGGWIVVCLVMIISPLVISQFYICLLKNITNIVAIIYLAQLFIAAMFAFEEVHDGGIQRCVLFMIKMLFVVVTSRIIPQLKQQ